MKIKTFIKIRTFAVLLVSLAAIFPTFSYAALAYQNGKLVNAKQVATMTPEKHFECAMKAIEEKKWYEAADQCQIIINHFPLCSHYADAHYFLAVSNFNIEEYDFANENINSYLKCKGSLTRFEDAVALKFSIAEKLRMGALRRIMGTKQLPKWASGHSMAIEIYDEVALAMPSHPIAAQALLSKGKLLWEFRQYRESVDAFQMCIRRFPKHESAPECYLAIIQIYLDQCRWEYQNPDILAFADLILRKFKNDFPREERIALAEANVKHIKEIYAGGLYDTGQFYERKGEARAAILYYQSAINQFPDTDIALQCHARLKHFNPNYSADS